MNRNNNILEKRILVTGGAGFIGSNIVDHLISIDHKHVVVLDNLETGSLKNIEKHIASGKIKFINNDIRSYETCLQATENIDVVLHQAALGSVPRSIKNPLDTNATNLDGFINILEASRSNNVKRFIYASSSSVYGSDKTLPKKEEITGTPLSPYAVTKKANELYANVYSSLHGMEIIGLRYFNVFGPKQNPLGPYAAVIPIFINNLLGKKDCLIYGDGENKRDFTYIDNVVQANILAAVTNNTEALNQVYNIAFGSTLSVNSLFEKIKNEMSATVMPVYHQPRQGEITNSFADITKAKTFLNYQPEVSIEEGIKKNHRLVPAKSSMIVIVDYGIGNLASVLNMFKKIGVKDVVVSGDKEIISKASKILLPGVGAFDAGMTNLENSELIPILNTKALTEKIPVLGICLGMQLLSRKSEEGVKPGLGWIDAETVKFNLDPALKLKVPHMGWNYIHVNRSNGLLETGNKNRFYFVHSYHVKCSDEKQSLATSNFGIDFTCAVNKDNIFGTQFHPEKSLKFGMKVLENFAKL